MVEGLIHLVEAQLRAGQEVEGVLGAQVLAGVVGVSLVRVQRGQVPHLELGAVGPGLGGGVDQAPGEIEAAVVVDPDLGDHECRRALVEADPADRDGLAAASGDGDQPPALADERHIEDLLQQGLDLLLARIGVRRDEAGVEDLGDRPFQIHVLLPAQPAQEVAVGEDPVQDPVLVDAADDGPAVLGDLGHGGRDRLVRAHGVLPQVAVDDHWSDSSFELTSDLLDCRVAQNTER